MDLREGNRDPSRKALLGCDLRRRFSVALDESIEAMMEFTCDRWGCLAVNTYNSDEEAFSDGWRGWHVGWNQPHDVEKWACPNCAPELWKKVA
jgi:hypothetical protein